MKQLKFILLLIFLPIFFACEKVDLEDAPDFDRTDVISFSAYDANKKNVMVGNPIIDKEEGLITITIKPETDLMKIFTTCTLSSGADILPRMESYIDWTSKSKKYVVTSASGKRSSNWEVIIQ